MLKSLCLSFFCLPLILCADIADDWTEKFSSVLQKYVADGEVAGIKAALVNYNGLREDPTFKTLANELANLPSFDQYPPSKQLALWINSYNFLMLKVVADNPGIGSVKDLSSRGRGSIWKAKIGTVAGVEYSPDEIEHEVIKENFHDPRTHFALVCASLSCPDLATYAYTGNNLEDQLKERIKIFLNNPTKGMSISESQGRIFLSKIFDWYKKDFTPSPLMWIKNMGLITEEQAYYSLKFFSYNWDLNEQQ